MISMIKGIIFDMDGLMLDTEKLLVKFWRQSADEHGFNMTDEDVFGIRSMSHKLAVPHLKNIFGESFDYYKIRQRRIELMNNYIEENGIEIKKGLFKLLDYLRENNYKTAVATATPYERAEKYLHQINAFDYFDKIIGGNMIENGKPAPDIYLTASNAIQLRPSECIALEDSPNGIKSAYSAGCKPVMIPDLTPPDNEIKSMLYGLCESLTGVIDILEKNRKENQNI